MSFHFDYFQFEPLKKDVFVSFLISNYGTSLEEALWLYDNWLYDFLHKRLVFYSAQVDRYKLLLKRYFCRKFGNEQDESDEYNEDFWKQYKTEWEAVIEESDLDKVMSIHDNAIIMRTYQGHDIYDFNHIKDCAEEFKEDFARESKLCLHYGFNCLHLDALWFDIVINNSAQEITKHRRMPYSDYLKTRHWHKIKSALMLICRGFCQEESCYGDSFYRGDWETSIHVHHLSYHNKGNERFRDLVLLCNVHHQRWHDNEENKLPQIKFAHITNYD